ncbi:Mitochondrial intermediate peptidase [Choanephora cucurbitarum]|uniref:mitochondrial intermediate peptidase n=1 Tax=Choanephora cucurbitarum TaxID=101091 RepID=A0A1C7N7L4_9FUNG|nr:Mitochondrial intermediate peptidase [Choanephora cucurbitarum]
MFRQIPQVVKKHAFRQTALLRYQSYATTRQHTASLMEGDSNTDSQHLRLIFDDNKVWKQSREPADSTDHVGFFENPHFSSIHGISFATQQAIQRAQILVERICNAPQNGPEEMRKIVKHLDRLSDTLCSVIDLAEFIRNAHPESNIMEAANQSYSDLCSYMNTLNTDQRIHQVLSIALADKKMVEQFSPDEHAAAIVFLRDFEKSGIHLPNKKRAEFVNLSDKIIHLGREFIQMNPRSIHHVRVEPAELAGLSPQAIRSMTRKDGYAYIPTHAPESQMVLKYGEREHVRKQVFEGMHSATEESIQILEQLMTTRADLATLVGNSSYAELQLQDKMAKNPGNVEAFLNTLLAHQQPVFKQDLESLQQIKGGNGSVMHAWDRDYYMHLYNVKHASSIGMPRFSVGSVIQGLSLLFKHMYGVEFQHAPLRQGEAWHDQVRKLDVICEQEGKIGTIYCDLFSRPGKTTHAAHYTIRTSRRVDNDDEEADIKYAFPGRDIDSSRLMPPVHQPSHPVRGREGRFQLPVIALTCDFAASHVQLTVSEVETLVHEMGHAMHSMLGRTDFHNVAGTRCASDFVELPSILMEHFIWHPKVLPLFGSPVSHSTVDAFLKQRKRFSGIELNSQILMALVDQRYHSARVKQPSGFSSQAEWYQLQDQVGLFKSVPGTMWPVQFGHLLGYGSNYYSYLFDRTLARRVWETHFKEDPLNRESGQIFRDHLLKWGGARDPWQCVAQVIGGRDGDRIARGDTEAMRTVGDWGR